MKTLALSSLFVAAASLAQAAEPQTSMLNYVDASVRGWFADPALQQAIVTSNAAHADFSEEEIISLDQLWRAEIGQGSTPTITPVMGSAASDALRGHVESSAGRISEIILMDNRGMNVAISAVTSDFWQGDEAKFQETFSKGANAVHVGDIELDESSQTYQAQVSFVVTDAAGTAIGAVTIGLNAEMF